MGLLDGKVAIVTGGGRGIGRAEALLLAAEGARVVVNDLGGTVTGERADARPADEVVDEIVTAGGEAVANTGDVADWHDAEALVAQAVDTFGGLDILINNAGVVRSTMSFNSREEDFDVMMRVHVKGTFSTTRFAASYWRERAKSTGAPMHAAVVNTSSPNGLNGGVPGNVVYAAAKSAIATMTITYARELAPYGVRCNAIGPIAFTRMSEPIWGQGLFVESRREEHSPEGVAAVAAWLASPLSAQVNGQILGVHGHECVWWENWRPASSVAIADGRWTIDRLDALSGRLFAGRDTGIPANSIQDS